MVYKEFIENILNTRGRFACGDEYHERHHIVPRCMGGTNDKENLIDLFAREHFEAHRLLALENPSNKSLQFAWWNMCQRRNDGSRYIPTPEEYEECRKIHSKNVSELFSGRVFSEEHKKKMRENHADFSGENHYLYGKQMPEKTKNKLSKAHLGKRLSEETKKKIGEAQKGKQISKETREKLRQANMGHKVADETKRKISEKVKERLSVSENNPFYGRRHSKESRRKISKNHANVTGENNPNAKITCQYNLNMELINIWRYKGEISKVLGINNTAISACCLGNYKTAGGFKWKYLYDTTKKDGTVVLGAISLGLITEEEALKILENKSK